MDERSLLGGNDSEEVPEPLWRRRSVRVAAALVLILIVAGWCWHRRSAAAPEEAQIVVSVQVAQAQVAPMSDPIEVVGTIQARQEATLSPKISGQISSMALLKNRVVRRGEVLATLEARD